jgi:hypothetical protein
MSRLTLRLPETLHQRLETLAHQEGVSLNQYIVYALTQQSTIAGTVHEVPGKEIAEQRASYIARIQRATIATDAEIDQILAEREPIEPEPELTPEIVERVKQRIASARSQQNKPLIDVN